MKPFFYCLPLILFLTGCHNYTEKTEPVLTSIQILDRNGITETISSKDRLIKYDSCNFSSPQPYHQVLRMYSNATTKETFSLLTSYHPNGYLHQFLEIKNGRAHGSYKKYFENGKVQVEATVIEGSPSFSSADQEGWVFDGKSKSYDQKGNLVCYLPYEKGILQGEGKIYFSTGTLQQKIPYDHNQIEGTVFIYYPDGSIAKEENYVKGKKNGITKSYGKNKQLYSWEEYSEEKLLSAKYYDSHQILIAGVENGCGNQVIWENDQVKEFRKIQNGLTEGLIQEFTPQGKLYHSYNWVNGQKNGEEIFYDLLKEFPKISLTWKNDQIHGKVKTWYPDGTLESQKEYSQNKKQGLAFAWYPNGKVMLHEAYENDTLQNGSYYSKDQEDPISCVIAGNGIATLYDQEGIFLTKVHYRNGVAEDD